jgi:hypothetical protein
MRDFIASASDELRAFLVAFNLDRFGVGRHIVRDERGLRIRDIHVQSMWLATIEPSFDPMAYVMVMHTEAQPQVLFCFRGADSLPDVQGEPVECPGLDDRVSESLKHVDLCPRGSHLVLDGIGYSLHVRTSAVSADLTFGTPKAESLRTIGRALFEVAESVARITARQDMKDYLKIWRRYLS